MFFCIATARRDPDTDNKGPPPKIHIRYMTSQINDYPATCTAPKTKHNYDNGVTWGSIYPS